MKRLVVVDISSFIFRAFFAIRPMTSPKGIPVNAVYGTLTMLMKLLQNYNPTHVLLARDIKGGSFRNEKYKQYKANRSAPPEDLVPQFGLIEQLIEKMKIPALGIPNYEADDVIGAFVTQFKGEFDEIFIASSDKDLMQFIGGPIKMLDTMKDKIYGRDEVFEKMGVYPEQIVDYLSLLGDASDNIPGVRGIGAKGASKLLAEYKTLDEVLKNVSELTNKRAKTALETHSADAHLSKELVSIVTDLDLGFKVDDLKYTMEPNEDFLNLLDELNFKSIKAKVLGGAGNSVLSSKPKTYIDYELIKGSEKFDSLLKELEGEDQVYIEAFFSHDDYHKLDPLFFGFATGSKNYILNCEEFSFSETVARVSEIENILLLSTNVKILYTCLLKHNIEKQINVFDITQAHFVLDAEKKHDLQTMALEILSENIPLIKELRKENLEDIASLKNFEFGFAKRLHCGVRLYPWLIKKIKETGVEKVFNELDAPLQSILATMEWEGVSLDTEFYAKLEKEFTEITTKIESKVKEVSGKDVNLKSPKQVGQLLFEDLGLPIIKKTKTGASTDSSVLDTLAKMGESEIPGLILRYREIEKLNSTYIKALPTLVHADGKLHTHFNQHIAQTGRLSSDSPNLQNIPIRTENGRKLRQGFKAKEGHVLLGADYSQVELRLLAHLSEDDVMMEAFNNDQDIHAQTASEVFEVSLDKVSKEERGHAKAINFGLMYGQSSFGLSQTLGITPAEAKIYITNYFTRFSKVKSYLDSLKEKCEEVGYSETMYGRRRYIKDINSSNRQVKSMAERVAINSPIQGSAADIIKMAMLNIDRKIKENEMKSTMILQVHDELIFEVPMAEVASMEELVRQEMEHVVELRIPLKIDMGVADNWYDLK